MEQPSASTASRRYDSHQNNRHSAERPSVSGEASSLALPGFEEFTEDENDSAAEILRSIASDIGVEIAGNGWKTDVRNRVNSLVNSAGGEVFTGHAFDFIMSIRRENGHLQRRVENLERFKIGGWFCPECGKMCSPRQTYRPGMELPNTTTQQVSAINPEEV